MNIVYKKMVGLALVLLLGSGIAFAQPMGRGAPPGLEGKQLPPGLEKRSIPKPHIEPLLSAHGFALSGDEFHLLSVSVTRARVLPPKGVREMLRGNRSFEDILSELERDNRTLVVRGTLRFAAKHYGLNITSLSNETLEADIITLPPNPEVVGHISLSVSAYEGARVATGEVTIEGKTYRVLTVATPQIRALSRP